MVAALVYRKISKSAGSQIKLFCCAYRIRGKADHIVFKVVVHSKLVELCPRNAGNTRKDDRIKQVAYNPVNFLAGLPVEGVQDNFDGS